MILVVKDDKEGREQIVLALKELGIEYIMPDTYEGCLEALKLVTFDTILLDLDLGEYSDSRLTLKSGVNLLREAVSFGIKIPTIVSVSIEGQGGFPLLIKDVCPDCEVHYDQGLVIEKNSLVSYFRGLNLNRA